MLRAEYENKKRQEQGFFKMDDASITTIQDKLANDIYELTMRHKEEINKLLEEYDNQQIAVALELDAYEREPHWQDVEEEDN